MRIALGLVQEVTPQDEGVRFTKARVQLLNCAAISLAIRNIDRPGQNNVL